MTELLQGILRQLRARSYTLIVSASLLIASVFFFSQIPQGERSLANQAANFFVESVFLLVTVLVVDALIRQESYRNALSTALTLYSGPLFPLADFLVSVRDCFDDGDYDWLRNHWYLNWRSTGERRRDLERQLVEYCISCARSVPNDQAQLGVKALGEITAQFASELTAADVQALRGVAEHFKVLHERLTSCDVNAALSLQQTEDVLRAYQHVCIHADKIALVGAVRRAYFAAQG